MSSPNLDHLKQDAKSVFGQELNKAELLAYQGRLPMMVTNVRLLASWASKLGTIGPSQVQLLQAPAAGRDGDG